MKAIFALFIAAACMLAANAEPPPGSVANTSPQQPANPPPNVNANKPPNQPKPNLALPGIFFLTKRVSITSNQGVIGLAQGTRVYLVRDDGQTLHVKADDTEFDVDKRDVTRDRDIAQKMRAADASGQAVVAQAIAQEQQIAAKQAQERAAQLAAEESRRQSQTSAQATKAYPKTWNPPMVRRAKPGEPAGLIEPSINEIKQAKSRELLEDVLAPYGGFPNGTTRQRRELREQRENLFPTKDEHAEQLDERDRAFHEKYKRDLQDEKQRMALHDVLEQRRKEVIKKPLSRARNDELQSLEHAEQALMQPSH